jgi:hypothetical protein
MIKRCLFVLLALVVGLAGIGLQPARAGGGEGGGGGGSFHYSMAGKGAEGGWTNCPIYPAVNQVCTDTYLSVAEQVYKEDGSKIPSTTLSFYQSNYKIDRKGNYVFISDVYGYGENASLTIDNQLTSATASASVMVTTCTIDRRGNYNCVDSGPLQVSASWSGYGSLVRSSSTSHTISKDYTYNSHFSGTYRNATASGQLNGADLGTLYYADLFNSRWSEVYICRNYC